MYHLIYVSQAVAPMAPADLAAILASSRRHNVAAGITGLLIYKFTPEAGRGNFMQLLEGPEEEVKAAWRRIADDPRHHTKIVLEEGPIDERSFADWTMGFRDIDPEGLRNVDGFSDLGEQNFVARARAGEVAGALDLMRSFYAGDQDP